MPDRYGDRDDEVEPVVDFDSRRRARDNADAVDRARKQRERLAETRAVHAPLNSGQAQEARQYQRAVTGRSEAHQRELRIANCGLCDDDGYTPNNAVCDHKDHRPAAARGMSAIRAAMGWDEHPGSTRARAGSERTAHRDAQRRNPRPTPHSPTGQVQDGYGAPRPLREGGE